MSSNTRLIQLDQRWRASLKYIKCIKVSPWVKTSTVIDVLRSTSYQIKSGPLEKCLSSVAETDQSEGSA